MPARKLPASEMLDQSPSVWDKSAASAVIEQARDAALRASGEITVQRGRPKKVTHVETSRKRRTRLVADVRRLRRLASITQPQLATMLGVHVCHVSRLESGENNPSEGLILRYGAVEKVLRREAALRRKAGPHSLRWGGGAMKRLRHRAGITQPQLAAMLGLSAPYIHQLESGKNNPSANIILRYRAVEKALQGEIARRQKLDLQSLRWGSGAMKRLRRRAGISQHQLAVMLRVSAHWVCDLERGKNKPRESLILRYRGVEKVLQRQIARRRKAGLQSLRWGRGAMKQLRHRAGITQHQLAAMLGMSASHITHLENGENNPSANFIFRYRAVEKVLRRKAEKLAAAARLRQLQRRA